MSTIMFMHDSTDETSDINLIMLVTGEKPHGEKLG